MRRLMGLLGITCLVLTACGSSTSSPKADQDARPQRYEDGYQHPQADPDADPHRRPDADADQDRRADVHPAADQDAGAAGDALRAPERQ